MEDALTYCPVCDRCTVCNHHESPVKGQFAPGSIRIGAGPDGEVKCYIDDREVTPTEAFTAIERIPALMPPLLVTMPPDDVGPEAIEHVRKVLVETRNDLRAGSGIVASHGAKIERIWPAYEYLTFDEWLKGEGHLALEEYYHECNAYGSGRDLLESLMSKAWEAARKQLSPPQDSAEKTDE